MSGPTGHGHGGQGGGSQGGGGAATRGAGRLATADPVASDLENSGSLTGHILSQGRPDMASSARGNNTKVLVIGLVLLGLMVLVGLIAAVAAGDAVTDLFGGIANG